MKLRKPEENELRITTVVILFFILMLIIAHKCSAQDSNKIYICHRTNAETNPFVVVLVDTSSNTAHNSHDSDMFAVADENLDGIIDESDCDYLIYVPVDLILFEAVEEKNGAVVIRWATATELNSDYFCLESSVDGLNWDEETIKATAGNSSTIVEYIHIIPYLEDPFTYFRLTQVDMDGAAKQYAMITTKQNTGVKKVKDSNDVDGIGYDILGRKTKGNRICIKK